MAEQDKDQERTEQASPKRREEAKKRGQVAKSQEVASVTILLSCSILFYFTSRGMAEKLMSLMRTGFHDAATTEITGETLQMLLWGWAYKIFMLIFPVLLTVFIAGLLANYLQVGFIFSAESLEPKLDKIDPLRGFQKIFSLRSAIELLKNLIKLSIIGLVVFLTLEKEMDDLIPLMDQDAWGMMIYMAGVTFKILMNTCWVLIVLAVLDYIYQKWEFEKGLRMSKQEVKEEFKHTEGDPVVKARIRRLQREQARKRMMAKVPKADVVITNPTHLAVAIEYDGKSMQAPTIVAKGAGFIAEKIKEIAKANGVPVVENKPVAQLLYKIVDIGQSIPENLYKAVAEILAYVYNLKDKGM
jgi:flagellar biosynthesis protein FlhB